MTPIRLLALVTLCIMALLARGGEPHPSLPAIGSLDGLGVNIHFVDPQPGELEMIKAAGFKWVRMDLTWGSTERQRGEYDFSGHDRLASALEKQGMRAVFILDYGNPLYAEPREKQPFTSRAGTEEFRVAYAKWAAAAVSHFAGRGYLFELWNEPNNEGFWKPKVNAEQYAALAKAACVEIEKVAPQEALVGPATSTIDFPFIETCFKAGLLEHWCGVSVHPYRQQAPETAEEEYRKLRLLIRRYAPKDKVIPILSGEWGYSTGYPAFVGKNPAEQEQMQAQYLARMFLTNIANDVPLSIWYDWHDDGTDPKESEHHFGIVRHALKNGAAEPYEAKPAYVAVKTVTSRLSGMKFNKRCYDGGDELRFLLFSRAESQVAACYCPFSYSFSILPSARDWHSWDLADVEVPLESEPSTQLSTVPQTVRLVAPASDRAKEILGLVGAVTRLPLDIILAVPGKAHFSLELHNPTSRKLGFAANVALSGQDPRLMDSYGEWKPENYVSPKHTWRGENSRDVSLREPQLLEGTYEFGGFGKEPLWFRQKTFVMPANPLGIQMLPPGDGFALLKVSNPSGQAFIGSAGLTFQESGTFIGEARAAVELKAGQTEAFVKVPIAPSAHLPPSWQREWRSWFCYMGVSDSSSGIIHPSSRTADAFEPADITLPLAVDGDPQSAASVSLETHPPGEETSPSGTASMRLSYRFSNGWRFIRVPYSAPVVTRSMAESTHREPGVARYGLWVKGDGKGCQARIRFTDATGQVFQADGEKIDFIGWRFVEFPMGSSPASPLPHWGGANDGVIHYPIKWDSVFLLDNVSRQPLEGEIYLSAPTLMY